MEYNCAIVVWWPLLDGVKQNQQAHVKNKRTWWQSLPFFAKAPSVEARNPDGTAFIAFKTTSTVV